MTSIAWIHNGNAEAWTEGRWGPAAELPVPCDARGLLLAEGVFETILVIDGAPQWLQVHHQRWLAGALLLGLQPPPPLAAVEGLLHDAIERSGISTGALRLNWCRGSGPRGLAAPDHGHQPAGNHLFWLQLSAITPSFTPVAVIISPTEVRNGTSLLSRCKSFGYGSALIARRQATEAGADDALLRSSTGALCCATSANLLVQIDNVWLTPPLESGCLPGVMRRRALELGLTQETTLSEGDLERSSGALLLNSLGCRPIQHHGRTVMPGPGGHGASARAEQLWRQLLDNQGR
ncbi:MAG: aminotransferase class IV [Cyanobacteriota bacterium]|nr:aminotransferase class IV [Cyanobacteriota bacterium]